MGAFGVHGSRYFCEWHDGIISRALVVVGLYSKRPISRVCKDVKSKSRVVSTEPRVKAGPNNSGLDPGYAGRWILAIGSVRAGVLGRCKYDSAGLYKGYTGG